MAADHDFPHGDKENFFSHQEIMLINHYCTNAGTHLTTLCPYIRTCISRVVDKLLELHRQTHSILTRAQSQLRMKVNKLMFRFHGSGN